MKEWKTYKLSDVCRFINGRAYSQDELLPQGKYQVLRVGNVGNDGHEWYYSDMELPNDKYCNYGDLLYTWACNFGPVIWTGKKAIYHYHIWKVEENPDIIDRHFLFYLLLCSTESFKQSTNGSVMIHITKKDMERQEVRVPSLEIQKQIASILDSLYNKIELNNRINHNLEEQAQALYKSYFVDFEPFKNGKFIESELGLIPEGWKIGKINDVINLLSGFPFKSSDFQENGDYQLITIKGVQDGYLDVTSADMLSSLPSKMPQYCILNIGDILISLTGNVGRICIVDRNNLLLNQRVAILSPKNIRDSFYVYTMFRSESMKNELIHLARGTAQLNLSPIETGEKLTVIPPNSILEAFAKVGKGTFNQYISLKMENIRLMEMRDSLLLKLMSGDLKLNEIDC